MTIVHGIFEKGRVRLVDEPPAVDGPGAIQVLFPTAGKELTARVRRLAAMAMPLADWEAEEERIEQAHHP